MSAEKTCRVKQTGTKTKVAADQDLHPPPWTDIFVLIRPAMYDTDGNDWIIPIFKSDIRMGDCWNFF